MEFLKRILVKTTTAILSVLLALAAVLHLSPSAIAGGAAAAMRNAGPRMNGKDGATSVPIGGTPQAIVKNLDVNSIKAVSPGGVPNYNGAAFKPEASDAVGITGVRERQVASGNKGSTSKNSAITEDEIISVIQGAIERGEVSDGQFITPNVGAANGEMPVYIDTPPAKGITGKKDKNSGGGWQSGNTTNITIELE